MRTFLNLETFYFEYLVVENKQERATTHPFHVSAWSATYFESIKKVKQIK
jgi:hypothetical protein